MNDLKFAFRQLVKNPGFTVVAVLTLALGIGVNVAVFSMANAVLWPPLNFAEPNQLVQFGEGDKLNGNRGGVSASNFRDLAEHSRSFSRIAAMRTTALNLGGVGNPERLVGAEISEDYFSVLRVEPQLGRFLAKEDFASGEHVALISHRLWITRFGAGTNIFGESDPPQRGAAHRCRSGTRVPRNSSRERRSLDTALYHAGTVAESREPTLHTLCPAAATGQRGTGSS